MPKVILGNHMAVFAARTEQDRIRKFYRDVLGCKTNVQADEVDRFQLGDVHYIFVWQDAALSTSNFLKATYLELKTDNVEQMKQKILNFGVHKLELPDPHLYFQAPGGQVFRLVGINEDLSVYEESSSSKPGAAAAADSATKADDFHIEIRAKVSPEEAAEKICQVSKWWTKGFTGKSNKPGDKFTVRFGKTFVDFQIAELVPGKKIVWQVIKSNLHFVSHKTEWTGTKVVWEITRQKSGTKVSMTHVGLVPAFECFENCNEGWTFYVGKSLLQFLNTGKGLPDRE